MQTNQSRAKIPHPPKYYTTPTFVEVGDTNVAYRRQGKGEPVVFLHGAGFTRMWLPMYERMATSLDFIAPEHPGMGETPLPLWVNSFDDITLHYDAFFDQIGLDRFHLIGYSGGGWMSAEYASFFHRRLKSLVLLTPVGMDVPEHPVPNIFTLRPDDLFSRLFNDPAKIVDFLPDASNPQEIAHLGQEISSLERLMGNPFRYNQNLPRHLKRVRCPTLVIKAGNDRLVPPQEVERYAEVLPNARLLTLPAMGHGLAVEEPEQVADAITAFVSSVR